MQLSCFSMIGLLFSTLYTIGLTITVSLAFGEDPTQAELKTTNAQIYSNNSTIPVDLPIKYRITSGELGRIFVESEPFNTVRIIVNSTSPGQLTIELPRKIIDAKQDNGVDLAYQVYTSNIYPMPGGRKDADFQEIENTSDNRMLSIDYPVGTANQVMISIKGTHVMPEFSGFAFISLGVAMGTVLAMTIRFHGRIRI